MTNFIVSRALSGILQRDGKPIANAKITRSISWNESNSPLVDYFETDAHGRFAIPAKKQHLAISPLTQYVAKMGLTVEHGGTNSELWYEVIMDANPQPIGDTNNLVCEFEAQAQRIYSPSGLLGTTCRWKDMPEEEDPYSL